MRVSIPTQLSIYEWGEIMGINPWELAQIGAGFPRDSTAQCQTVFFQFPWQRDFISREEVAKAISDAEYAIADQLGYWPAPRYFVDERVVYPRPYKRWLRGHGFTPRGDWKSVDVRWKKVIGGGVFNRTVIDDTVNNPAAAVQSDPDGVNELFTITVATALTDADEIAIYYKAADRNNVPVDETWRIRPVKVVISGGNAVITGNPAQLVLPSLTTVTNPTILTVTNAAIYADEVEVYRVFRDTTHTDASPYQGVGVWDVLPGCSDGDDCEFEIKPICIAERINEQGQIGVQYEHPDPWPFPFERREPDRLRVNYLAGEALVNNRMNGQLARMVAYLATALLPSDKCGCDRSNRILHYWRAKPNEGDDGRQFTQEEINSNPFIERNGGLWAWKRCRDLMKYGVVSL